jgi:single-strand DNA-binding protein
MPAVKNVGEPCAREPHARFDGGREETKPVGLTQPRGPGASRLPDQPQSVLTLGLAVRKSIKPESDDAPTADFFDVTVWGAEAENCAKYLRKGRLVAVSARLEPTSWEAQDGPKRRGMAIVATAVEFLDRPQLDADSPEEQPQEVPAAA